jgi:serine/threonine-protein kinase
MSDPFVGRKVLGRYRIVRSIGRGGMGLIYLARQEGAADFVKPVVVKRATPDLLEKQPALREFMGREARIMSHLHHPAIVSVLDFAEEDGAYLLVLDYVHGYHLGQWSRFLRQEGRRFPFDLAIHVVCKVLDALHYAHTVPGPDGRPLGIVHRDVSPGNVLLDVGGAVKLADFGIARMHSDHTETDSHERLLKGKMSYMAPELLSLKPPTAQSDLYAAAVLLHELLAGKNELHVTASLETTVALIFQHLPTPISQLREDTPRELDDVISRGLAKAAPDRYADAAEFARALRHVRGSTEEEMGRRLAKTVGYDFRNPRMAEGVGGLDLETLSRAWREAPAGPAVASLSGGHPVSVASPAVTGVSAPAKTPGKGKARALALGAGVLATTGVVAVGVYAFAWRRETPVAPAVLVVSGQVSGSDGLGVDAAVGAAVTASADPGPSVAQVPEVTRSAAVLPTAPPIAAGGPHAGGGVDALTRAFARQQSQVAHCFDTNASDLHGAPEIAIRFGVDTQGHVTAAQVLPPEVASTPLGLCLAAVARATQFGTQAQSVSFRIPIVARRGP